MPFGGLRSGEALATLANLAGMGDRSDEIRAELEAGGFIAAREEAAEMIAAAAGDERALDALLARRLEGEPLAWITGRTTFCGINVLIDPGVYVPRTQSEPLALRAAALLPPGGIAIDLCCGSGAIARVLADTRPGARVLAADVDQAAVTCAVSNAVEAYRGDLFAAVPDGLAGTFHVIVAVVPYVPTPDLSLLQRDTFGFESPLSYDGGADGTSTLRRIIAASPRYLRPGGHLLLELGGDQTERLREPLEAAGFMRSRTLVDEDGDVRGIEARLHPGA